MSTRTLKLRKWWTNDQKKYLQSMKIRLSPAWVDPRLSRSLVDLYSGQAMQFTVGYDPGARVRSMQHTDSAQIQRRFYLTWDSVSVLPLKLDSGPWFLFSLDSARDKYTKCHWHPNQVSEAKRLSSMLWSQRWLQARRVSIHTRFLSHTCFRMQIESLSALYLLGTVTLL